MDEQMNKEAIQEIIRKSSTAMMSWYQSIPRHSLSA